LALVGTSGGATSLRMSSAAALSSTPLRSTRSRPFCSTTSSRLASPGAKVA